MVCQEEKKIPYEDNKKEVSEPEKMSNSIEKSEEWKRINKQNQNIQLELAKMRAYIRNADFFNKFMVKQETMADNSGTKDDSKNMEVDETVDPRVLYLRKWIDYSQQYWLPNIKDTAATPDIAETTGNEKTNKTDMPEEKSKETDPPNYIDVSSGEEDTGTPNGTPNEDGYNSCIDDSILDNDQDM